MIMIYHKTKFQSFYHHLVLFIPFMAITFVHGQTADENATTPATVDEADEVPIDVNQIPYNPTVLNYSIDVGVLIYLFDVEPYDGQNMDFRIDYYLRQVWWPPTHYCKHLYTDVEISETRMQPHHKPTVLNHQRELLQIWLPDTFITNAKEEAFSSEIENLEALDLIMFNSTHCILDYLLKMNAKISCQLNYRFYPLDVQYCSLSMRSYTSDTSLLKYHWIGPGELDYLGYTYQPQSFATKGLIYELPLRLTEYELDVSTEETVTFEYYDFSTLVLTLIYRRNLYDSIKGVYLPSSLVVWMSWLSLWIHLDEIGRVLNNMTCFLALITQFTSLRGELPAITYINGSDIWMLTCMIMVFLNLLQFTIVKYIQKYWNYDLSHTQSESELNNFDIFEAQLNGYLMRKNRERLINTRRIQFISKSVGLENHMELMNYLSGFPARKNGAEHTSTHSAIPLQERMLPAGLEAQSKAGLRKRRRAIRGDSASQYAKIIQNKLKEERNREMESSCSSSSSDSEMEDNWVKEEKRNKRVMLLIEKIDFWCRIAFPASYVIFNIIYWPIVYSPLFRN